MSRCEIQWALAVAAVASLVIAVVVSRRAVVERAAAAVAVQRDAGPRVAEEGIGRAPVAATARSEGTLLEAEPAIATAGGERPTVARSLTVVVVDESGAPIEGARVEARRRGWSTAHVEVATDARGLARISDPRDGDELRASATEHLERTRTLDAGPWPEPYAIPLARGEVILRGLAVGDRGEPVASARIEATDGARAWRATSDECGRFELRAPLALSLPEVLVWHVEAGGYCFLLDGLAVALPKQASGGRVLVPLARWARLEVRVVDAAGAPLAGARPRLLGSPDLPPAQRAWIAGGSSTSVAMGLPAGAKTTLERVPPIAPLWLEVEHAQLGRREVDLGALEPGESRALTVAFDGIPRARPLLLRVVDSDRRPVPSGRARVAWRDGASAAATWLELDPEGRCEIDPPASEWEVEVVAPGFAPHRSSFVASDVPDDEVEIAMEPSFAAIEVIVVDARGVAVSGVLVELNEELGPIGSRSSLRTDASGLARFDSVEERRTYRVAIGGGAPGAYYLPAGAAELVPDPAQHCGVVSGRGVRFRLVPPGSIEGVVSAAAAARIHASCMGATGGALPPAFTVGVECDSNGAFRFGGLPPGRYRIWSPAASSSLESPLAVVDLAPGETRELAHRR